MERGHILIHDLRQSGMYRILNTGASPYALQDLVKFPGITEKEKNYMHACLKQQRQFSPFFFLVYGILCDKADAMLKRLIINIASKW